MKFKIVERIEQRRDKYNKLSDAIAKTVKSKKAIEIKEVDIRNNMALRENLRRRHKLKLHQVKTGDLSYVVWADKT